MLWSDCAYAHAGLSLYLSHIPHCWKSHVMAYIWTSLLLFREMLRPAITDLFCFGAKSPSADLYSQTKFQLQASRSCQSLHFQRKRELTCLCLRAFLWNENIEKWNKKNWVHQDSNLQFTYLELFWLTTSTSLRYQRISLQLYQDVYLGNCSKHTDCTRSITKN